MKESAPVASGPRASQRDYSAGIARKRERLAEIKNTIKKEKTATENLHKLKLEIKVYLGIAQKNI